MCPEVEVQSTRLKAESALENKNVTCECDVFMNTMLWARLCKYTNIYASKYQVIGKWANVCVDEMRVFLSVCVMMELKKLSSYSLHWSKKMLWETPKPLRQ